MEGGAAVFEDHVSIGGYEDGKLYADNPELFADMLAKIQALESLEGVLAVHVGVTKSLADGKRNYVHHFRSEDKAARKRVLLAAHAVNANFLLKVCDEAKRVHEEITADPDHKAPGRHEHHVLHKLSSKRINVDFGDTAHADWEANPSGSPAPKFSVVRVGLRNVKPSSEVSLDDYITELRGLPARFPLLKQVSVGKNIATTYAEALHYPPAGDLSWDVAFVFGYDSVHDKDELDSLPEFKAFHSKWTALLGEFQAWDLSVDRPAN